MNEFENAIAGLEQDNAFDEVQSFVANLARSGPEQAPAPAAADPYAGEIASARKMMADQRYQNQSWSDWAGDVGRTAGEMVKSFLPTALGGRGEIGITDIAQGAFESAKSAATLPGDALAGRVQPFDETGQPTEEMLRRSSDFAGAVTLGAGAIPAQANTLRMGAKVVPEAEQATASPPSLGSPEGGLQPSAVVQQTTLTPELQAKVKKLEEEVPNFSALSTHLNADEVALVSKDRAEEMVELFTQFPAAEEMASVAFSGKAKKGWYERSARALVRVFGADDAPRFTALLAATSPQTSVESNLTNALRIWMAWDRAGRPTDEASIMRIMGENVQGNKGEDSVLGAWINNSMTALTAADPKKIVLSGPKVNSFMLNLRGVVDEVTNDAWMANYGGVDQGMFAKRPTRVGGQEVGPGKGPGYMAFSALARRAAKVLSERTGEIWTPAEIQETVWSWAKTLYEKRIAKGETRTARQIVEAGDLTDQEIGATPDFELLFVQDAYRQILEGEKYGRQLEELSGVVGGRAGADAASGVRSIATRPEGAGIDADAFGADLRTAASRLDQLADDRARDSAFFDSEGKRKAIDLRARLVRPNAKGEAPRSYGRGNRGDIPGTLIFSPPKSTAKYFEKAEVSAPAFLMRKGDQASAQEFISAMTNALAQNKYAAQVEIKKPEELIGAQIFMTSDKAAGFAIKPDGDIVSVFSTKDGPYKGIPYAMLQLAVENGGRKLDAFDTFLPDIYAAAGFKPVARIPWNDAFAPEKWDKQLFARYKSSFTQNPGEPDIVFFVYDPEYKGGPTGGFRYQSYDDALSKQATETEAVQKKLSNRVAKAKKAAAKKIKDLKPQ